MESATQQFAARAILFDLDGVLVDSTGSVGRVWRDWALRHNLDPEAVIRSAHGRRSIETIRAWAPQLEAEKENMIVEQAEIDDTRDLVVIPGAPQLLSVLPPERLAVVTSGTRALATSRLRAAGLPIPSVLITADEVVQGKPSPEPYVKGAERLGFAATDCMVFEDTPPGIESAHAAGAKCVALLTTYPAEKLAAAEAIIQDFHGISIGLAHCTHMLTITLPAQLAREFEQPRRAR
jgi:mannitol-1-/sugar-/sorbitol-6-phosphatase